MFTPIANTNLLPGSQYKMENMINEFSRLCLLWSKHNKPKIMSSDFDAQRNYKPYRVLSSFFEGLVILAKEA